MKSIIRIVFCGSLALLGSESNAAGIEACVPSSDRVMAVTGTATVRVPPDRASFSVGVESESDSVGQAFEATHAKVQALLEALKRKGIQPDAVQTSSVRIAPRRDPRGRELPGYRVSNMVTVTLDDPERTGELLQTAVSAGANRIAGVRFFVADTAEQRKHGLELAFQDARAKAEVLATLAKQSLGDVVCVSEAPAPSPYRPIEHFASRSTADVPVEPGTETIIFSVDVVFELR